MHTTGTYVHCIVCLIPSNFLCFILHSLHRATSLLFSLCFLYRHVKIRVGVMFFSSWDYSSFLFVPHLVKLRGPEFLSRYSYPCQWFSFSTVLSSYPLISNRMSCSCTGKTLTPTLLKLQGNDSGKWVGQNNDVIMEYNDVYIMCIDES